MCHAQEAALNHWTPGIRQEDFWATTSHDQHLKFGRDRFHGWCDSPQVTHKRSDLLLVGGGGGNPVPGVLPELDFLFGAEKKQTKRATPTLDPLDSQLQSLGDRLREATGASPASAWGHFRKVSLIRSQQHRVPLLATRANRISSERFHQSGVRAKAMLYSRFWSCRNAVHKIR